MTAKPSWCCHHYVFKSSFRDFCPIGGITNELIAIVQESDGTKELFEVLRKMFLAA